MANLGLWQRSLLFLTLAASSGAALADNTGNVQIQIGQARYTKTDGTVPKSGTAPVMAVEYSQFFKIDRALYFGYRQATDTATQKNYYMAACSGLRLYLGRAGHPVDGVVLDNEVRFDSLIKPYVQGGFSLGRAIYNASFVNDTGEQGADIFGMNLGTGISLHPLSLWSVDLSLGYEMYQAHGGTAGSLNMSGTNIFILFGTGYLM